MRSRDLLLSAADYDWVTNYYTKWLTGREVQKTDTRWTKYVTSWTTRWVTRWITEYVTSYTTKWTTEYTVTTTTPGSSGKPGTAASGNSDNPHRGPFGDITGAWGAYLLGEASQRAIIRKGNAEGWTERKSYRTTPNELGRHYYDKPSVAYIKSAYIGTGKNMGMTEEQVIQHSASTAPWASLDADHWEYTWNNFGSWAIDVTYTPATSGTSGSPSTTTTKKRSRTTSKTTSRSTSHTTSRTTQRVTQRDTVRQTTFKYYHWTYYQTSQSTSRTTKWYTDRYSSTRMTGVDPNQRYQGHLLSQTYYDRSDESNIEYGYKGENDSPVPIIRRNVYNPKIGTLPNRQAIDPNSNKWMESREDRQANQNMSKNIYSRNKNELLNSQPNKRNLQTYYVHTEEQETSSGAFGSLTK